MNGALTTRQIRAEHPAVSGFRGLGRFSWVTLQNMLLNPFIVGFSLGMPVLMYLMFGANQDYSDISVGKGNVAAQILVTMTLFGTLLSAASLASGAALERSNGVSRMYALTPLSPVAQLAGRGIASVLLILSVTVVTFTVGFFTGAQMTAWTWLMSALMIVVASTVGAAIGIGLAFAVRSDTAYMAVSAVVVLSAFAGGLTLPLDQLGVFFQTIAPWTPLWGAGQIVQMPLLGWTDVSAGPWLNLVGWILAFSALGVWGIRRDTAR